MSFTVQKFSALRIFSSDVALSRDWYKALFGVNHEASMKSDKNQLS